MKKINSTKLALNAQTVRHLSASQLGNVGGGNVDGVAGNTALCANTQQPGCVILTTACPTNRKDC